MINDLHRIGDGPRGELCWFAPAPQWPGTHPSHGGKHSLTGRLVALGTGMLGTMRTFLRLLRGALHGAFQDNAFSTAKGATYSFLLALFPALLVLATLLAGTQHQHALLQQFAPVLNRVLPVPALRLVESALTENHPASMHLVISAALVAVWSASSLVVSWMEGFQKAYGAPPFPLIHQRLLAFWLAFASLAPLLLATLLVSLGGTFELWLVVHYGIFRPQLLLLWEFIRWIIALIATVLTMSVIYHQGVNLRVSWHSVYPGALVATLLWIPSTIGFVAYVRHYAEYSTLYGNLAAVILLMVWMYILSLAVLVGAEFNSELALHRFSPRHPYPDPRRPRPEVVEPPALHSPHQKN